MKLLILQCSLPSCYCLGITRLDPFHSNQIPYLEYVSSIFTLRWFQTITYNYLHTCVQKKPQPGQQLCLSNLCMWTSHKIRYGTLRLGRDSLVSWEVTALQQPTSRSSSVSIAWQYNSPAAPFWRVDTNSCDLVWQQHNAAVPACK